VVLGVLAVVIWFLADIAIRLHPERVVARRIVVGCIGIAVGAALSIAAVLIAVGFDRWGVAPGSG
jgi:hypothetical protein